MKTIKIAKYQIKQAKTALLIFYAIMIIIAIMMVTSMLRIGVNNSGNVSIGGLDFSSIIFIFVIGITSFKQSYYFMQANNITRKGFLKGNIFSIFPITAFMSLMDIIINQIINIFCVYNSMFSQIYLRPENFQRATPNLLMNFIWSFAILSLFYSIGYFIALVYYRSNTIMKILVSITPFILINVLGYLNSLTNGVIGNTVYKYFNIISGLQNGYSPHIAVINMLISFIVFCSFSFLLIRKAPVK